MPQVPRISRQTQEAPLPGPRLQGVPDVTAPLATGLGKIGGAIAKIAADEKDRANRTRITELGQDSTKTANDSILQYENDFKLEEAAEFTDVALAKYKASNERLLMEIGDEKVREDARLITRQNEITFENGLQRYAAKERLAFEESVFNGAIEANRNEALINRESVEKFFLTRTKIRADYQRRFEGQKTKDEIDAIANKEVGKVAAINVSALIDDQDFDIAERYLQIAGIEESMPTGLYQKLLDGVKNGLAVEEAERYSDEQVALAQEKNLVNRSDELQMVDAAREQFKDNPTAANVAVQNIQSDFAIRNAIRDEVVKADYKKNYEAINNAKSRGAAIKIAQLADADNQGRLKQYAIARYPLKPSEARSQIGIPAQERKIALARSLIQQGDILSNEDLAAKFSDLSNTDRNSLETFLKGVKSQDRPNEVYLATKAAMTRMKNGVKPNPVTLDRTWRAVLDSIGSAEITPEKINGLVAASMMTGDVTTDELGIRRTGVSGLDALEDPDKFRFFLPDITDDKQRDSIIRQAAQEGKDLNPPGEPEPDFEERKFLRENILQMGAFGTSAQDQEQIRRANTRRAFRSKARGDFIQLKLSEAVIGVKKAMDQETFTIENPDDPSNPDPIRGADALLLTLEESINNEVNPGIPTWMESALAKIPSDLREGASLLDDLNAAEGVLTFEQISDKRRQLGERLINLASEQ